MRSVLMQWKWAQLFFSDIVLHVDLQCWHIYVLKPSLFEEEWVHNAWTQTEMSTKLSHFAQNITQLFIFRLSAFSCWKMYLTPFAPGGKTQLVIPDLSGITNCLFWLYSFTAINIYITFESCGVKREMSLCMVWLMLSLILFNLFYTQYLTTTQSWPSTTASSSLRPLAGWLRGRPLTVTRRRERLCTVFLQEKVGARDTSH